MVVGRLGAIRAFHARTALYGFAAEPASGLRPVGNDRNWPSAGRASRDRLRAALATSTELPTSYAGRQFRRFARMSARSALRASGARRAPSVEDPRGPTVHPFASPFRRRLPRAVVPASVRFAAILTRSVLACGCAPLRLAVAHLQTRPHCAGWPASGEAKGRTVAESLTAALSRTTTRRASSGHR